jgi:hypothetical protein
MAMRFIAYRLGAEGTYRLVPACGDREWMRQTPGQFAKRCLPLLLANQSGWFVLNEHEVRITWTGAADRSSVKVELADPAAQNGPVSHFGSGIVTWNLPYLFRTPPGWNLLVRGPPNWPKDGICPLEGLVETDWSVATFTVNWILTRPNMSVMFAAGEPLCLLVPQHRRQLEHFSPEECPIGGDPATREGYDSWSESRQAFLNRPGHDSRRGRVGPWQGHYFRGTTPSGSGAPEHQTKVHLRPFGRAEPARYMGGALSVGKKGDSHGGTETGNRDHEEGQAD